MSATQPTLATQPTSATEPPSTAAAVTPAPPPPEGAAPTHDPAPAPQPPPPRSPPAYSPVPGKPSPEKQQAPAPAPASAPAPAPAPASSDRGTGGGGGSEASSPKATPYPPQGQAQGQTASAATRPSRADLPTGPNRTSPSNSPPQRSLSYGGLFPAAVSSGAVAGVAGPGGGALSGVYLGALGFGGWGGGSGGSSGAQHQQQQQQQQQQQNKQTLVGEADHWKSLLLSEYVPPGACAQLNVPVLMQQTAAAIAKWGELQQSLDATSDAAPANLAAQAQVRSSLKRDLTNLTQLADAQTKHTQRMKMRHMQAMAMKAPAQGGFRGGAVGGAAGAVLEARGGAAPPGEGYSNLPPKRQVILQQPPGTLTAGAATHAPGAAKPSPYATSSGSAGVGLAQQGGGAGGSGAPGGGAPQVQNNRLQGIRQRIDRTEPASKWVVLVEASIRLPPTDGPTFEQFTFTIQNLLTSYNGDVGAEVARALGTCLDPRVFDPMNIKRAQERMADIYARFRRSSQRF